ncbi:hypothetical protein PLESTF_001100700 [Pleodorina starrii]|nr:hypothetical protein PLESTF_001100700 [Pleodorina starrii]
MSELDSDDGGSDISENPFEIDVDAALRAFGAPVTASATSPGEAVSEHGDNRNDTNMASPSVPAIGGEEERPNVEADADETRSSGSDSDPDVIHIDLTQRPPPLPMSGLSLEEIVSMLPGSTYAVSGSGIPIRTSPRSEPLQRSPSAQTSPKPQAAEAAAASTDSGRGAGCGQHTDVDAGGEQAHAARGSGGQGAGSSPGSQHVALTFIPGFGLVPVVIHDALEHEEEEEDEEAVQFDEDSMLYELGDAGAGAGAEEEDAFGPAAEAAAAGGGASSGAGESLAADGLLPRCVSATGAGAPGGGQAAFVSTGAGPDNVAGLAVSSSARVDISKGKLSEIIQQVIQGLDYCGDGSKGAREGNGDGDHPEGSLETSEEGSGSPERQTVFERLFSAGGRPVAASGDHDDHEGAARQLLGTFERSEGASSADAAAAQPDGPLPAGAASDPEPGGTTAAAADEQEDDQHDEWEDEYEDDLVEDDEGEGDGISDEVDDSGSGGGDEPESILGGLAHARMGFAADGVPLGSAALATVPAGQYTSTTVEASGIHTSGSAARTPAPAPAAKGVDDPHFTVRVSESCSGVGGLHLPRPRYLSQNGAPDDDSPIAGGPGSARREAAAGGPECPRAGSGSSASDAATTASDDGGSSFTATPATRGGSGIRGSSGGGCDLNSTLRTTGQSLAAIRQAALLEEARRQAKTMAERLGGGADKGTRTAPSDHSKPGAASIRNPFGCAEHEASAAAGLIERPPVRGGGGSTGSAHLDGRHGHTDSDEEADEQDDDDAVEVEENDAVEEEEEEEADLVDLLRDRNIIQPRYPTDAKRSHNQQHQHHHHEWHEGNQHSQHHRRDSLAAVGGGSSELSMTMELDGSGGWRPRHRRSVDVVDLGGMLAKREAGTGDLGQTLRARGGVRGRSLDGSSTATPLDSRSLTATHKSDDDGLPPPPLASRSPRMRGDDIGSDDDSSSQSSSAHSVADEHLADEMEALREELGQKTTLVAGLRGELRKYTDLAMRLEHQLSALRSHAGPADAGSGDAAAARARNRAQSEAGILSRAAAAPLAAPGFGLLRPLGEQHAREQDGPSQPRDAAAGGVVGTALSAPAAGGRGLEGAVSAHALPPHPQAQGLEVPARLTLYREILSKAQLQVGRCGGPAPPDLRDVDELLKGKDGLDAGTEKVMLIKLQKMLTWGVEAAWKASVAAQQAKAMEHAAQQAAAARAAWEAEREQLWRELEEARAAAVALVSSPPPGTLSTRVSDASGGSAVPPYVESELRRQLQAAQDEAAAARGQAADLESAVACLNADVRKLKVQLRNSLDGASERVAEGGGRSFRNSRDGGAERGVDTERLPAPVELDAAAAADAAVSRADSKGWALERKLLVSTITTLNEELEQARAAAADAAAAGAAAGLDHEGRASPPRDEAAARKVAMAEAALERMAQLQAERDAEAEAAEALRVQLLELRQELALASADLAAEAGWRKEGQRALEEEREAGARREEAMLALRQQLATSEAEREELEVALRKEVGEKHGLEDKLRQAREALESALQAAAKAHEAMEQQASEAVDKIASERDASQDVEEAFRAKSDECERLQLLVESRSRELALAESQLDDVRTTVSELQDDAADTQAQVLELQELLMSMQRERVALDAELAAAKAEAAAAEERAVDAAAAASLLAQASLTSALEEAEALRGRVAGLEAELAAAKEEAERRRGRAEEAEAELEASRAEAGELRACVAGLQAEARDLRTALSAEDSLQAQLRGQVECLESELEAQASLAQSRSEQAARMEAALVAAEHQRHDTAAAASEAAAGELLEVRATAAAAQERVLELEARVAELQAQLADAVRRCELAAERVEILGRRVSTEPPAPDGAVAAAPQPGPLQRGAEDKADTQEGAAATSASLSSGAVLEDAAAAAAARDQQLAALQEERTQLLADCVALQAALEQARSAGEAGRREVEAQAEGLRQQLAAARSELTVARSELTAARAELTAASVELSVKAELMAAKDRSLATLQESVDALKLALQVTQQNVHQPTAPSPRRSTVEAEAADGEPAADRDMQSYRGSVAALHSKFADSESTIRRLEQQVAALETRLSTDDVLSPTSQASQALVLEGRRLQPQLQPQQPSPPDASALEQQPKEKEADADTDAAARLLLELQESTRGPNAATAAEFGHADSVPPPHGLAGGGSGSGASDALASAATINGLQVQLLQWQSISEDLHVRYQAKKDTARRLREQLAAEQQRRADDQAMGQVQLEAAAQRLGRLVNDFAATLRRCIALDLQPLSASALTTSPRALPTGGVLPEDINSMAALLARQGSALIESLEAALDQVNAVREERALVTAQLANRQSVLDELRHHLARQAVSAPGKAEATAAAAAAAFSGAAGGGAARTSLMASSPPPLGAPAADILQAASTLTLGVSADGAFAPAGGTNHSPGAGLGTAAADASPHAAPSSSPSPSPSPSPSARALHAAAANLAQDMAALSAQQAGLRSTLLGFEQRPSVQLAAATAAAARPRSMSAAVSTAAYTPLHVAAGSTAFPRHSVMSYPALSPRLSRNISVAPDSLAATIPSGSPPHAYVGILSGGGRVEPRTSLLGGATSTGGGLHGGLRQPVYGVYGGQPIATASSSTLAASPERARALEMLGLGRDAAALRSPSRSQFSPGSGTGGGGLAATGSLGVPTGAGTGLGLPLEGRLNLAEKGL